jgi:hypothetical protein
MRRLDRNGSNDGRDSDHTIERERYWRLGTSQWGFDPGRISTE